MGAALDRNEKRGASSESARSGLKYFLCVERWHGRTFVGVCSGAVAHPREDKHRFRHIPLSDGDAALEIQLLERLYVREIYGAEDKVRDAAFVARLVAIIRTSWFDGEIANAKALYEKVTGRAYQEQAA